MPIAPRGAGCGSGTPSLKACRSCASGSRPWRTRAPSRARRHGRARGGALHPGPHAAARRRPSRRDLSGLPVALRDRVRRRRRSPALDASGDRGRLVVRPRAARGAREGRRARDRRELSAQPDRCAAERRGVGGHRGHGRAHRRDTRLGRDVPRARVRAPGEAHSRRRRQRAGRLGERALEGLRAAGAARRLAGQPRPRPARRGPVLQGLHHDLRQRPERAARRGGAQERRAARRLAAATSSPPTGRCSRPSWSGSLPASRGGPRSPGRSRSFGSRRTARTSSANAWRRAPE